jgi:hypothetical protein
MAYKTLLANDTGKRIGWGGMAGVIAAFRSKSHCLLAQVGERQ